MLWVLTSFLGNNHAAWYSMYASYCGFFQKEAARMKAMLKLLLTASLLTPLLTGCWDRTEVNDLALVTELR